jgi:hypothetical protein
MFYTLRRISLGVINPLRPCDKYIPSILTISNAAFCIYVFCMILSVNRNYFLKEH